MGTYPIKPRAAFLAWVDAHADLWQAEATEIGLSPEEAAAMTGALDTARQAVNEQGVAQDAARSATLRANLAVAELQGIVARNVARIRVHAADADDPGRICARAAINPIAPRSPTPPPGRPSEITAELLNTGAIALTWTCRHPPPATPGAPATARGVLYEIERRLPTTGESRAREFQSIGISGERSFIDDTLPAGFAGAASIEYRITAVRSTRRGQPALLTVTLGVTPDAGAAGGAAGGEVVQPRMTHRAA